MIVGRDPEARVRRLGTVGGAALVALGVFRRTRNPLSLVLVVAGVAIASLATLWTLVVPLLAIVLVVLVARRPAARPA